MQIDRLRLVGFKSFADAAEVAIGGRVEMTFRRLFTAEGIHNYFWKARLVR